MTVVMCNKHVEHASGTIWNFCSIFSMLQKPKSQPLLFIYSKAQEDHLQRSEMHISIQNQVDCFFEGCTNAKCRPQNIHCYTGSPNGVHF